MADGVEQCTEAGVDRTSDNAGNPPQQQLL